MAKFVFGDIVFVHNIYDNGETWHPTEKCKVISFNNKDHTYYVKSMDYPNSFYNIREDRVFETKDKALEALYLKVKKNIRLGFNTRVNIRGLINFKH